MRALFRRHALAVSTVVACAITALSLLGGDLRPAQAGPVIHYLHGATEAVGASTYRTLTESGPVGSLSTATASLGASWQTFTGSGISLFVSPAVPAGQQWQLEGTWSFGAWFSPSARADTQVRARLYRVSSNGTATLLFTSGASAEVRVNANNYYQFTWNYAVGSTTLVAGERFGVDFQVQTDGDTGTGTLGFDTSARNSSVTAQVAITSVPGAPTGATAVAGDAQATVTWSAPASDGGSAITGYTVTSSPGGLTATVGGATLEAIVTGLTNGTEYTFTVHATNALGDGAESSPSNAVTPSPPVSVPGAPTNAAAAAGDTQAAVTWSAPASDGGSAITGYTVTSSPGGLTATVGGGTLEATVTGLTNGTEYTFTVYATNAVGDGPASAASNAVTPSAPSVPGAPTNVVATAGNQQASVTWSAAPTGGSTITSYTVTSSPGGLTATVDGSVLNAVVTGLTNGVAYTFTVYATNALGNGPASAPSNAVTPQQPTLPGAPTNVVATGGNQQATVTWSAAPDGYSPLTGYTVTSSPGAITVTVGGSTLEATVAGLTNGVEYTFTVYATNALGDGPASAPSNAVTPAVAATAPGAPTSVAATAGYQQATVTWSAPASNGGSAITGYTVTSSPGGLTASVGGSTLQATVTGLTNGVAYTFTVRATNIVGDSPESSPSNTVTPTSTAPTVPLNVLATPGNATASVSWEAPQSDGGSAITGYTATSTPGGLTATVSGQTYVATVTGLTNGVTYTFTVRATNEIGDSPESSSSNQVTPSAAPWPDPPTPQPPAHNFHQLYAADTSACAACHRVHTATAQRVLYKTWPEENVCFTCHDGSAAPDIQTQFAKPYRMPIALTAGVHTTAEARTRDPLLMSAANRHAECVDCHNPHLAGAGNHTVGTNYTAGPQQGVWGVAVSNVASWAAPTFSTVYPVTMQYQVCFKCHSSWAYGSSPPTAPSGGYAQTDQAKEFNTLNAAYHPVEDVGKNPFLRANGTSYAAALINGLTPTSRIVCSDCHMSETAGQPAGPHGSNNPFILRGLWNRTTGNSNTSGHLCFTCHSWNSYGPGATGPTGFSETDGTNLHGRMVGARNKSYNDNPIVCMDCHVAIPHGYYRDHLIGYTGDGAPYINRPYSGGLVTINQWRASGQWTFSSCSTAMNGCK